MGLTWQQWYQNMRYKMRYHFSKLIEYFDNILTIIESLIFIWQSINWHVRVVSRPKLLLQCWSFSTTAPTTCIASKPWKPRQTMDQTSATSVEVPKRLSDFSPQTFFKSIQLSLQKFHKWCTQWKVEQPVFNLLFHHTIFDLLSFPPQAETDDLHRQGLGISGVGHKFIVPMASLKWQVAIPVSCHEAPLLATMWKNWTQQILDNLPWMTKRERKLTFCNQLTSTYTSRIQKPSHIEKNQCVWQNI